MVLLQVNGAAMEGRHSRRDLKRAYGDHVLEPI
jgi:hypothetical protein